MTAEPSDVRRFDPELAARFRAALGYAGLQPKDAAAALGVSERTLHRLRTGQAEITREIQEVVVEKTGVPEWFLQSGFDPAAQRDDPSLAERTEALEQQMETVLQIIARRAVVQAGSVTSREGRLANHAGGEGEGRQG